MFSFVFRTSQIMYSLHISRNVYPWETNKNGKVVETTEKTKVGAEKYNNNLGVWHDSALRIYCQVPAGAGTGEMG